ncbi:hypothetical protein [Streptomyces sp. NPDC007205]|uniref:hypothetical protein n=1 Tax=Streptomyces sp. NPDC007205 TaxID=3154316 RepID=UPI00340AB9A6
MNDGWAAVVAAAIGLVGAALGAVGGYVSGRAQARSTVQGVQLQLSGQRADALWQAELDACALFVDACNRALYKLGQVVAVSVLEADQAEQLSVFGIGSRDELLRELRGIQDECALREVALRLRMPSAMAVSARGVGHALTTATDGVYRWSAARAINAENEQDRNRDAQAKVANYRQLLNQFTIDAQERYSKPHPALDVAL